MQKVSVREAQLIELLLQGCENCEIALALRISTRTVKAHFNRLFRKHNITSGIKRVKLAVMYYRKQLEEEKQSANENSIAVSAGSS